VLATTSQMPTNGVRDLCLVSSTTPSRGALCPMRARGPDRNRRLVANLHVNRSARQRAPAPSQGGRPFESGRGYTEDQHNTAAYLED
jgi:hypothetical protein